jgi:hypothetical protein
MVLRDPRRKGPAKRRGVALSEAGRIPNRSRRMIEKSCRTNVGRVGVLNESAVSNLRARPPLDEGFVTAFERAGTSCYSCEPFTAFARCIAVRERQASIKRCLNRPRGSFWMLLAS